MDGMSNGACAASPASERESASKKSKLQGVDTSCAQAQLQFQFAFARQHGLAQAPAVCAATGRRALYFIEQDPVKCTTSVTEKTS